MDKKRNDYIDSRIREISQSLKELRGKRTRRKPREEDRRRKYDYISDHAFLRRYEELGRNQSALAREMKVSQPAVRKRLVRAGKEVREGAQGTLAFLKNIFGD